MFSFLLTHFQPVFNFYTPRKQKTIGFPMFSEGIEKRARNHENMIKELWKKVFNKI